MFKYISSLLLGLLLPLFSIGQHMQVAVASRPMPKALQGLEVSANGKILFTGTDNQISLRNLSSFCPIIITKEKTNESSIKKELQLKTK